MRSTSHGSIRAIDYRSSSAKLSANLGFPKDEFEQTYGTVGPNAGESQTPAATEKVDISTESTTTQVP